MEDSGYTQVYGINTEQISDVTGLDLGTDYVQVAEGEPGVLNPMPLPQMDRGNHLSYGFQWIAFGIMAPLGLGYFIWAEMRERRRDKAEREQMAELNTPEPVVETPEVVETAEPPITPAASKRRSRYGDQHRNHYEKISKRDQERF